MEYTAILIVIASLNLTSYKDNQGDVFPTTTESADTYFPPLSGSWETRSPESLEHIQDNHGLWILHDACSHSGQ
ncbi:hypothetical protein N9595_01105 [Bacteroidia bacterium]|nr:hypothetical protein [Bacteroidia bacterium]